MNDDLYDLEKLEKEYEKLIEKSFDEKKTIINKMQGLEVT